jgi:hypothetical protein
VLDSYYTVENYKIWKLLIKYIVAIFVSIARGNKRNGKRTENLYLGKEKKQKNDSRARVDLLRLFQEKK